MNLRRNYKTHLLNASPPPHDLIRRIDTFYTVPSTSLSRCLSRSDRSLGLDGDIRFSFDLFLDAIADHFLQLASFLLPPSSFSLPDSDMCSRSSSSGARERGFYPGIPSSLVCKRLDENCLLSFPILYLISYLYLSTFYLTPPPPPAPPSTFQPQAKNKQTNKQAPYPIPSHPILSIS
ncbi:hypothetical protein EYC84_007070 [Monilinia fructicola]|uniref:Uncharacterized protein n=1 Tax=Monilinia fructicola TaxID=38448 RepID=A0A5M9K864_MONFR|nr:hypothetical protein EYC84_007070 [Monilinia fructicola]